MEVSHIEVSPMEVSHIEVSPMEVSHIEVSPMEVNSIKLIPLRNLVPPPRSAQFKVGPVKISPV
jgi:hypothetical protein